MTIPDLAPVIPGCRNVALIAPEAELSAVWIRVAVGTSYRYPIELQARVTTGAFHPLVAQLQRQTCLCMVELDGIQQRPPIVGGVTFAAIPLHLAVGILLILRPNLRCAPNCDTRDQDYQAPTHTSESMH